MLKYIISITVLLSTVTCQLTTITAQPVMWMKMEDTTANSALESLSNTTFSIVNNRARQEAITGVKGNALRLNGYSNWIEGTMPVNLSATEFSLSVWVALESYPVNTAGIFSNLDNDRKSGLALLVDKFGQLSVSVAVNNSFIQTQNIASLPLEKFSWQHIVVSINTNINSCKIYQNGAIIKSLTLPQGTISWQTNAKFYLGKSSIETLVGIFNTNTINAAIDEFKIFNTSLSDSEVSALYQNEKSTLTPNLSVPANRYANDIHRPHYHAMPASAWTNEPHGLVYQNGLWHLFFQKNANGPYWSNLNWGHLTSKNLISWNEQKPVLTPKENYDKEGCWSGTIVLDDKGVPTIIYTGVDGASAHICSATSSGDMSVFQKLINNPLIQHPPVGQSFRDFRDPYIWKENNLWYMIVGSGINSSGSGGTVILYKSTDLVAWEYIKLLRVGHPADDDAGVFWEMPLFVKFPDNRRILLVNKTPDGTTPAKMLYWTGTFQDEVFTSSTTKPQQLEQDLGHLSPSVNTDANGRVIAMGIIPDNVNATFQKEKGYAHTYSLPREWSLSKSGNLKQKPIVELEKLRGKNYNYKNLNVGTNQTNFLTQGKGRQIEIRAKIATQNAARMGFVIAQSADGSEKTSVYYDFISNYLTVDRNNSSTNQSVPRGQMGLPYAVNQGDTLDLHIFLDGSVLEVFLNEDIVISTHIFPAGAQSIGVDAFSQGGTANFLNTDVWIMKDMTDATVGTKDIDTGHALYPQNPLSLQIIPNPISDNLVFEFENPLPQTLNFIITNAQGQLVKTHSQTFLESLKAKVSISLGQLPAGLYILSTKASGMKDQETAVKFYKQ